MKIANPKIQQLLNDLGTLSTFAGAAAQSAAQEITSPVGVASAGTAVLDDLIGAYKADEQADRGALFKGAIAKMKTVVTELEGLDVLVEPEAPAAPSSGTLPMPPLSAPAGPPAAETAPAAPAAPTEPTNS